MACPQNVDGPATWKVIRTGVVLAAIVAPIQIFVGDLHGLVALENQPAKIAAVEEHLGDRKRRTPYPVPDFG